MQQTLHGFWDEQFERWNWRTYLTLEQVKAARRPARFNIIGGRGGWLQYGADGEPQEGMVSLYRRDGSALRASRAIPADGWHHLKGCACELCTAETTLLPALSASA